MRRELGCVLTIALIAATAAACAKKNNAAGAAGADTMAAAQPAASPAATTTPAAAPTGPVTVPPNLPSGVTAAMIQEGNQIFHGPGNCFTCHGQDAKGTSLAPDLTVGQNIMLARVLLRKGCIVPEHSHPNEQLTYIAEGALKFWIDGQVIVVAAGECLTIPPNMPHKAEALEDTVDFLDDSPDDGRAGVVNDLYRDDGVKINIRVGKRLGHVL